MECAFAEGSNAKLRVVGLDVDDNRAAHQRRNFGHRAIRGAVDGFLEALGEQLDGGNMAVRRKRADDRPIAGTRLIREWQGTEHCVTVLVDGYEYQGRPYRSLSAVARAITGTRWNGWVFFGIRRSGAGA